MRAVALLALAAGAVSAQEVKKYKSSLDMAADVDISLIDDRTRGKLPPMTPSNTCNILCDKDASTNDCDYSDLSFKCICAANKSAPGLQYYDTTMPTYICKALFDQCIQEHIGDADGQEACSTNIDDLCATLNPNKATTGGSSDDDDEEEDGDDEEEKPSSTAGTTAAGPTTTTVDNSEKPVSTSVSDGLAAPTSGPKAAAAMAALGLVAALV
ncbi:hypothetical protein ACO1O0_000425 [Amphichorda felina]